MANTYLWMSTLLQQMPHHDPTGGVWWTHWIWMIIWVVLLVLIIAFVFRAVTDRGRQRGESARDVLERRYAEGGMSTEEYEERKRRLS